MTKMHSRSVKGMSYHSSNGMNLFMRPSMSNPARTLYEKQGRSWTFEDQRASQGMRFCTGGGCSSWSAPGMKRSRRKRNVDHAEKNNSVVRISLTYDHTVYLWIDWRSSIGSQYYLRKACQGGSFNICCYTVGYRWMCGAFWGSE